MGVLCDLFALKSCAIVMLIAVGCYANCCRVVVCRTLQMDSE